MATKVTAGDDDAYRVDTTLSLSREQITAVGAMYNRELNFQMAQTEMIRQLADTGYNTEKIDEFSNDPRLVSEAAALFDDFKAQTIDPRLFNAVQQTLLQHDIIRIVDNADDVPDNQNGKKKTNDADRHPDRNNWGDTIYD